MTTTRREWYPCTCGAEHNTPTCPFGYPDAGLAPVCVSGAAAACRGIGRIPWCDGWICAPCRDEEEYGASNGKPPREKGSSS